MDGLFFEVSTTLFYVEKFFHLFLFLCLSLLCLSLSLSLSKSIAKATVASTSFIFLFLTYVTFSLGYYQPASPGCYCFTLI